MSSATKSSLLGFVHMYKPSREDLKVPVAELSRFQGNSLSQKLEFKGLVRQLEEFFWEMEEQTVADKV